VVLTVVGGGGGELKRNAVLTTWSRHGSWLPASHWFCCLQTVHSPHLPEVVCLRQLQTILLLHLAAAS